MESTASAANIFLGQVSEIRGGRVKFSMYTFWLFILQSEVFLLNKPFLPHMTKSELTALMAAGLATVAGTFTYLKSTRAYRIFTKANSHPLIFSSNQALSMGC